MGKGKGTKKARLERLAATLRHQDGVVSLAQLRAAGFTDGSLRTLFSSIRLVRELPGVYRCAAVARTWLQAIRATAVWLDGRGALSHRTAARFHGLEGCESRIIEFVTPIDLSLPRRCELTVHRVLKLDPTDRYTLRGVPVTTPTRTLIDLAALVDMGSLETALNDAIRKRLTSADRLRAALDRLGTRGRRGTARLAALLAERRPRERAVESALELRALTVLIHAGLPRPRPQHEVREGSGRVVARVDFAYVNARVAIEVDGFAFHAAPRELRRDAERSNALQSRGWVIVRLTAPMLDRPDPWVAMLRRLLRQRAASTLPDHGSGGTATS